jgi:hypothetical protein
MSKLIFTLFLQIKSKIPLKELRNKYCECYEEDFWVDARHVMVIKKNNNKAEL